MGRSLAACPWRFRILSTAAISCRPEHWLKSSFHACRPSTRSRSLFSLPVMRHAPAPFPALAGGEGSKSSFGSGFSLPTTAR